MLGAVHAAGEAAALNGDDHERVGMRGLPHSLVAVALTAGLTLPEASALARHANPRVTAAVVAVLTDTARAGPGDSCEQFGGQRTAVSCPAIISSAECPG